MDDSSQELSDGIDEFNEQREDAYSELGGRKRLLRRPMVILRILSGR